MSPQPAPIEYIEARSVLLDALAGLREHLDSVILVGAQAVYLRTEGRLPTYQPFTTDADLVLDPARLAPSPSIGAAMEAARFALKKLASGAVEPGVWERRLRRPGRGDDIVVPVDLIVPEGSRLAREDGLPASAAVTGRPPHARVRALKGHWWIMGR